MKGDVIIKSIILAGGSGTRLWPLSREQYPKQFLQLGNRSLFQDTVMNCTKISDISEIFIVTNESQKFYVLGQIEELGFNIPEENVLVEPDGKNTLLAICFGMREIEKKFGRSVVGIFSSDHVIDTDAMTTIAGAEDLAHQYLVTFGIVPKSPHTGYGYIKPGYEVNGGFKVSKFKEKPDQNNAIRYVDEGYLWNSGMFLFDTDLFFSELSKYFPQLWNSFTSDKNINEIYRDTTAISIDYGILEKSSHVAVVTLDCKWSDLGNFSAIYDELPKDEHKNVVPICDDVTINSEGNLIYSTKNKVVSLIDVNNMVIVDTPDALLVCARESSQRVKEVVDILKKSNDIRTELHRTVYRPWGSYTIMEESMRYKIRKIRLMPDKTLSLQLHHHRSEHWIVVTGTACVYVDGKVHFLRQGESTFIRSGVKHRLSNPGKFALEIIEVQLGEYVGEDDIIRFEDGY